MLEYQDTPKDREIARQRQRHYLTEFKIDLPIIFYNPECSHVSIYSKMEQRLDTIEQQINAYNKTKIAFTVFSKNVSIQIDAGKFTLNKSEATEVLTALTNMRNGKKSMQDIWNDILRICTHTTPRPKLPTALPK